MPIDTSPGGTDIVDLSGNGKGADINSDDDTVFVTDKGLDLAVNKVYCIGDVQVLGPRQTGIPAAATDLTSALTLLNYLRTLAITHGQAET